ncbi:MAG: 16S rRNA (uracil(1498)-N(3))-methyltransferase [Rhodothermales bacterium]|nr:16S rRNA (uracil(1498)-N(3))-methyltransferase [Rhodothermales bacterium]
MSQRHITAFYAPPSAISESSIVLPKEEATHAVRVLRMVPGDLLTVVDGVGGWFEARLESISKDGAAARIESRRTRVGEPDFDLTIAIGFQKSRRRYEFFLEKAVELGVSKVVPLVSERTEGRAPSPRRCAAVALAAMKQSGRSVLTAVAEPRTLDEVLADDGVHILCHEGPEIKRTLLEELAHCRHDVSEGRPIKVFVGPEGGFSDDEVGRVRARGGIVTSLGKRRLRTETAGIAVCATVSAFFDHASR